MTQSTSHLTCFSKQKNFSLKSKTGRRLDVLGYDVESKISPEIRRSHLRERVDRTRQTK